MNNQKWETIECISLSKIEGSLRRIIEQLEQIRDEHAEKDLQIEINYLKAYIYLTKTVSLAFV